VDVIAELKLLAGISNRPNWQVYSPVNEENISYTGTEKAELQRKHNIQPGTQEWFRLWFARPYLTKETPI
jgi:hypothetical protein